MIFVPEEQRRSQHVSPHGGLLFHTTWVRNYVKDPSKWKWGAGETKKPLCLLRLKSEKLKKKKDKYLRTSNYRRRICMSPKWHSEENSRAFVIRKCEEGTAAFWLWFHVCSPQRPVNLNLLMASGAEESVVLRRVCVLQSCVSPGEETLKGTRVES